MQTAAKINAAKIKEAYNRRELIDGQEIMMSPPPLIRHRQVQFNLSGKLYNFLRGKRCRAFVETLVFFDAENHCIPDVLVVCDKNKIKRTHIEGAPDFIAEILSPSTRKYDLGKKKDIYEKYGVKEYWVIDPADETVDTYIRQNDKLVLDNSYHNYSQEDWEWLDDTDKADIKLTLKLSLYDDLEFDIKELFEE